MYFPHRQIQETNGHNQIIEWLHFVLWDGFVIPRYRCRDKDSPSDKLPHKTVFLNS